MMLKRSAQYTRFPGLGGLRRLLWLLVAMFFGINSSVNAEERDEYEMINITAGQVDILDDFHGQRRIGIEYHFKSFAGPSDFRLIPSVGVTFSHHGANYIYGDIRHDFYLNPQWLLIPSFGVGKFNSNHEIDLGHDIEFRTGIELSYQFKNKVRTGIAIFHLSNGGLSSQNPGTEVLVFSVSIPVSKN